MRKTFPEIIRETVVVEHYCQQRIPVSVRKIETINRHDGVTYAHVVLKIAASEVPYRELVDGVIAEGIVDIPIDFCPWCGERLVDDDE